MTDNEPVVAVVQRVLSASPEVVYDEWLDPEALADWMCPHPARPTNIALDPRVGGQLRLDIEDEGVEFSVVGRFVTLDRPERLTFTWSCSTWADPKAESIVTVVLEPLGDAETLMTIRHELLPPGLVANHEGGWDCIAQQLEQHLAIRR